MRYGQIATMLSGVWIVPVWMIAVATVCLRPLLRRGMLLIMSNTNYRSIVNRVVDYIMSHHDDAETLVSFLRSPDVVGIVKDYCGTARRHDSFLYTYARWHTVRQCIKGVQPDLEQGRPLTLRERYHSSPTELEDKTRQVIEADGILILLRALLALVTIVAIVYQSLIEKDTLDTYHVLVNVVVRFANSGIWFSIVQVANMTFLVTSFRYPSLSCTSARAIVVTVWWTIFLPILLALLVYVPYTMLLMLMIVPTIFAVERVESLPYLGTALFSISDKCIGGYHLYVLDETSQLLSYPAITAGLTASLCWIVSSFDGWWEHAAYDFYRRMGFMVPTDMVSIFQLLSSL